MKVLATILPAALNQVRQGATFLSIKNYEDNFGGISHFGIVFHVDYMKAVKKAWNVWYNYKPRTDLESDVRKYLLESYRDTLRGYNPRAKSAHAYRLVSDGQSLIRSVKWHDRGAACHFWGFGVHKVEIVPPTYPDSESSAFSIMRRRFMAMTQLNRFRQFKVAEGRFSSIGIERLTLTQKDLLRKINENTTA